jgi:kynurenine formamidase
MDDPNNWINGYDLNTAIDIAIPLQFNGPQPNAFGADAARSEACEFAGFVGDTRRGGSCNFETLTFIPHCNGTHTECVGHITHERIAIRDCLREAFLEAWLCTVTPVEASETSDTYPKMSDGDLVITRSEIEAAEINGDSGSAALIVRTHPNDEGKMSRIYRDTRVPYFSSEAMDTIVKMGFRHLLVDLPSIDRLYDDGKLANHRRFWHVAPDSFETSAETRMHATVTELIFVPDSVADGRYALNLQIAAFMSDASPSRPILFPRFDRSP